MALAEAACARAEAAREAREVARTAREVAREAREVARAAREVAREVISFIFATDKATVTAKEEERELFAYRAGKVKEALHPSMLVMALLYPVVIGFTLQARWWHVSVDEDKSVTFSAEIFLGTLCSFLAYSVVHIYLLAHMRIVGPHAPKLFLPALLVFLCVGITYFLTYVTLFSWYRVHPSDWAAMGGFSIALFMMTLAVAYWSPVSTAIFDGLPELPPVSKQEGN